jgi:NTP pyrophosphatase (non-canonical NTP hydrolase)
MSLLPDSAFSFNTLCDLDERIIAADKRYGPFASTHEALGVALEEWDELREAVRANNLDAVRAEALDLAAVLIRLADGLEAGSKMAARSVK